MARSSLPAYPYGVHIETIFPHWTLIRLIWEPYFNKRPLYDAHETPIPIWDLYRDLYRSNMGPSECLWACCCWQGCTHLTNCYGFSHCSYTLAKAVCHGIELTEFLFKVTALPLEANVASLQVFEFLPEAVIDRRQIAHLTTETCDVYLHNLHQDHIQIVLSLYSLHVITKDRFLFESSTISSI